MKIIISHDVDHITAWEHRNDLVIPKLLLRSLVELGLGYIRIQEIMGRIRSILYNNLHHLDEIISFNKKNNIPSTFFLGVSNGLGLNYSLQYASSWINKISQAGFDAGVHGIAYENFSAMQREFLRFKKNTGLSEFGIRMHYLRHNDHTFDLLERAGYRFDSSYYKMVKPFKVGRLWEFPIHIMDNYIFIKNAKWQNQTLQESKDNTKRVLDEAVAKNINYFTILFHNGNFADSYRTWKAWYVWLIDYLKKNDFSFIGFKDAIHELEA